MSDLQQQLDDLSRRVAALERQQGPPRLGPQPPTQEEVAERADRFVSDVREAMDAQKATDAKGQVICTTSGQPVDKVRAEQTEETGQHKAYIVLCEEERKKGFVRPYRDSYKHVGLRPKYPISDLTPEQRAGLTANYVKFETYPPGSPEAKGGGLTGRYWTEADLKSGCGAVTTMGRALSETYARDPKFYGATFCAGCNRHLPVAEFVWTADGQQVGS